MKRKLNVGMIGYKFMGRAHSNAYLKVNKYFDLNVEPVMKVICGRNKKDVAKMADKWGWQETESDWRKIVDRKDVDAIDVCSPNNTHYEIVMSALESGKIVLCEKPLAMNANEAKKMAGLAKRKRIRNMVWFNYRRVPAVALAKKIISDGRLGKIFHYRGFYLQDWTINPETPMSWRLDKKIAGSGVTGDLLSHLIDTATYLIGDISSLTAMTETFIKKRPRLDDKTKKANVGIDDAVLMLCRFRNGAVGTFESTRYARGRKSQNLFEINGEKGSIVWDMEDFNHLRFFDYADDKEVQGFHSILVTESEHPYMSNWWVPGASIGYEHTFINTLADFLKTVETGEDFHPNFEDGLKCQVVTDAVLESANRGKWVKIRY